jgi:hypothetical protein
MEPETHSITDSMNIFFTKLLNIKQLIKAKADQTGDPDWLNVYEQLHEIIKQKGE